MADFSELKAVTVKQLKAAIMELPDHILVVRYYEPELHYGLTVMEVSEIMDSAENE